MKTRVDNTLVAAPTPRSSAARDVYMNRQFLLAQSESSNHETVRALFNSKAVDGALTFASFTEICSELSLSESELKRVFEQIAGNEG
jgi:hypothetical protein